MADFAVFKAQFKGDIVTPDDPDYSRAIARWAVNAQRRAKVVAFVKDEEDVRVAIKYARDSGLPIAIRGGGHNPAGASSSEGGLVIDLSRYLNGAEVDPEKRVVYVGGGALWDVVDKEAIRYGLATVAGTVNHTGVGGLILGGGYGWLSPKHGLAIDNLVQATVVTADGSILTASDTENPDLFFGIRGGGCNFGVVTEFVLRLHPQREKVYSGMLVFPPPLLERLVDVTGKWLEEAGEKEAMMQVLTMVPDGKFAILVFPFFNGSEAEGRENFKAFFDLGPIADLTKEMPYEEINALQNPVVFHGQGMYMKGIAQRLPHFESDAKAFDYIQKVSGPEFKVNLLFEYFPLAKVSAVPSASTAFRRDPTSSILALVIWKDDTEENLERGRTVAHELAKVIIEGQQGMSSTQSLGYSNYDPEGVTGKELVPDKAKTVFADNYPRLQKIKKRYDPDNIFNKWFPITPA